MKKKVKKVLKISILILLLTLLFGKSVYRKVTYKSISYNNFIKLLDSDKIDSTEYDTDKYKFYAKDKDGNKYTVVNPQTDDFKKKLLEKNVEVKSISSFSSIILSNISTLVYIGIGFLVFQALGKSLPSTVEKCKKENTGVKIDDIALPLSVKSEIRLLVDYLNKKDVYNEKGVEIPNGVLLYGPPGTGKTMIAKAVAGEANCNFYSLSGSDFVELYVGNGARKVRELFKDARKNAPCIIFIDEIDALGQRNADNNSERDQTINALLNELDGFSKRDKILVIAATNRIEALDKALTRAGRFGKHIAVPLPMSKEERLKIINIHKKEEVFAKDVDFEKLAKITTGFSGADIASILNEAVLISIHEGKERADNDCLDEAFRQFITKGHEKDKNDEEKVTQKRITAIHEAGHAIIAKLVCKHSVPMVSIIATTSGAGGYTIALPEEMSYYSLEFLENQIKMLYAGRAAETIFGHSASTGAANDIEKATLILKDMAIKYSVLDGKMINYDKLYDGNVPKEVFDKATKKSEQLMNETVLFLKEHIDLLKELSDKLMIEETIDEKNLDAIINMWK